VILSLKLAERYEIIFQGGFLSDSNLSLKCFPLVMLAFVLSFAVNEINNYVLMENVVKEVFFNA